jgi:hypothetical protein
MWQAGEDEMRIIAVLALFAGFVANVLVTWMLAIRVEAYQRPMEGDALNTPTNGYMYVHASTARGARTTRFWIVGPYSHDEGEYLPEICSTLARNVGIDLDSVRQCLIVDQRGFPLLSLESRYLFDGIQVRSRSAIPFGGVPWYDHVDGIELPRQLPLRPIWPGFAINTLLYAGILWPLFAAPFALRRRRRIKRGLCPACAYPVGASEVCTECGAAVASVEKSTVPSS